MKTVNLPEVEITAKKQNKTVNPSEAQVAGVKPNERASALYINTSDGKTYVLYMSKDRAKSIDAALKTPEANNARGGRMTPADLFASYLSDAIVESKAIKGTQTGKIVNFKKEGILIESGAGEIRVSQVLKEIENGINSGGILVAKINSGFTTTPDLTTDKSSKYEVSASQIGSTKSTTLTLVNYTMKKDA